MKASGRSPSPSLGILPHPAAAEGLNPPLLINPPVTLGIHGMLSLAGGRGRRGANLTPLQRWRETRGVGGRRGGAAVFFPRLHNLLPISGVIQRVFQMIISKSGVAALIQRH